ncbi:MAG: ATP-binding cassette domain-containing protein [Gammaproteobacteria bacterium]|nr:ATP-binding cassette domain-containing protein [Gammaproteobacteria bacterium]
MSLNSIIELQQLLFSWKKDGPVILDIQQLTITKNERVFIEGPSGCGKSSLLGLLGGITLPLSGNIKILGQSIQNISGSKRDQFRADHIGFIFQMFNMIPYLSMIDNVVLPCRFSKKRYQQATKKFSLENEAKRLLAQLGLYDKELLSMPVTELSIGQQQRVAAARALIGNPEIIIADEPTSSLDADNRNIFLDLLFQQCDEENSTLIFVSHDANLKHHFERTIHFSEINQI